MAVPDNQIDVVEVKMAGVAAGKGSSAKNAMNLFYFRRTTTVNTLNEVAVESAFQSTIAVPNIALLNNRYTQSYNEVRFVNDPQRAALQVARAVTGGIAGDSMAMEDMLYVLTKSALRGKSFRGNKKYFPLSEADTTGGTADLLNAGALAAWQAFCTTWLGGFTDSNGNLWIPIVLSRVLSLLTANPAILFHVDIVQIVVNQRISSMKKHKVASVY